MIYVVQVQSRKEDEIVDAISVLSNPNLIEDVFSIKKKRLKKFEGGWHIVVETCFKGYVFVKTDHPRSVLSALSQIDAFTKLISVGREASRIFIPLTLHEEEMLYKLIGGKEHRIIDISDVRTFDGKIVEVLSGPLKDYENNIIKTNFHGRLVTIVDTLIGQDVAFQLGINMKEKYIDLENLDLYY